MFTLLWMTIKTLKKKGVSERQIARIMGVSRNTVKRKLTEDHPPHYHRVEPYVSVMDEHLDFANHYGFEPWAERVCYPEGKGKVESSIKYIWSSFYRGNKFTDLSDLNSKRWDWLNNVCNVRIHGTHRC